MLVRAHEPTDQKRKRIRHSSVMINYKFFCFLMNSSQRNALNCLFRSTTTCFSLYRRQKPKPGELQYAELGELTGRGQKATMPRVSGTDTVYAYIEA